MNGKLFWVLVTAIFVVVGHLSYVLFVPEYKMEQKLAKSFVATSGPAFITLGEKQTLELFPAEDPSVLHRVCPFDVTQGPVKISIAPSQRYWSLSIYSQKGDSYYSINDRQAIGFKLKIFVKRGVAENSDAETLPELVPDKTVISAPTPKNWAVLRVQVYNSAARDAIAEQAKAFTCERASQDQIQQPVN